MSAGKTANEVWQAVQERAIRTWTLRRCSMCDYPLRYVFEHGQVFFDPGCNCVRSGGELEQRSYDDVAECFNMQTNPAISDRMWEDFLNSR